MHRQPVFAPHGENGLAIAVGTLIAISKTKPRLGTAGAVLFCPGGALTMEQCYEPVSA